jgi:hypothetical protein
MRIRCAKNMARKGEKRNACKVLVGKPEVKRSLGIPRRNVKTLEEQDVREWIGLILMNTVTYSLGEKKKGNYFNSSGIITTSRKDLFCRVGLN